MTYHMHVGAPDKKSKTEAMYCPARDVEYEVMVLSQMDYYIRANHSINGKVKLQYLKKLFIL